MEQEPITENYFYILLCLYQGESYGYEIMKETLTLSKGRVKISPGTMYGAVSNMQRKQWIREKKEEGNSKGRRTYELTPLGRQVLMGEVDRLKWLLDSAWEIMGTRKHKQSIT